MKLVLGLLLVGIVSGCSSAGGLQSENFGSTIEIQDKSYNEVWKASVRAMSNNLTIIESDKTTGTIKSEASAGMTTWGEIVGLFIQPTTPDAKKYTLKVISKKRLKTQITGQNWEPSVLANVKAELDI